MQTTRVRARFAYVCSLSACLILGVLLKPSADVFPQRSEVAFGGRVSRCKSEQRTASLDDLGSNANRRDSVVEAHSISGACRRAVVVKQNQLSRANAIAWLTCAFRGFIHRVADFGCSGLLRRWPVSRRQRRSPSSCTRHRLPAFRESRGG